MNHDRSRRDVLGAIAAGGAVALAGCLDDDSADAIDPEELPLGFTEDFTDGFEWERDATIGDQVDLDEWDWSIELSDAQVYTGERAAEVYTEGGYDDGLAFLLRRIDIAPDHAYDVEVSIQAWSGTQSDVNNLRRLACYLGPDRPETQNDFPEADWDSSDEGETDFGGIREPLNQAEGWHEHTFEWTSSTLDTDVLYFAVGVDVVWETDLTYYLDDVTVSLEAR